MSESRLTPDGDPRECYMADVADAEDPCWGEVECFPDAIDFYTFWECACQGHLPVYDGDPYRPEGVKG
jgi:hypothetical protein